MRIINLWRSIGNPIPHHPLAVADQCTVDPESDLVPTRYIFPDREGILFSLHHNLSHQWYQLWGQMLDEVTLIKCFDSDENKARSTPNTASFDPSTPKDVLDRQSIKVRCLIFDEE
jgi:hypothetical protein